jgi:DNA-directed RNA polymerase subunit E'/Rpb7
MGIETLRQRLVIDNSFLGRNLNASILSRLKEVAENDCTKEYGYIIKVIKLLKIVDNYISNVNSELVFIVDFQAQTLKPEVNSIFEDEIFLVLRGGIFFDINGKFKVLIPPNSLTSYTFNADTKSYENKTEKLTKGVKCKLKITGIRYINKKFDCFGELIV